jgi:hypothetical protein
MHQRACLAILLVTALVACRPSAQAGTQPAPAMAPASSGVHAEMGSGGRQQARREEGKKKRAGRNDQGILQLPVGETEDLSAFATGGEKIIASATGDLNGDGRVDALVVLDSLGNHGRERGKDAPRTILLLIRGADGQLQKVAQNDRIVPCAACGGVLGDPFGFIRISKNGFIVVIEGGSRQRWSSQYEFEHVSNLNDWHLRKVERDAYDTITAAGISRTFTPEDFGQVAFSDFDPSTIPEVVLP